MTDITRLWVYLSASPLLWLFATLAAYVLADRFAKMVGRHPLANPVMVATIPLALLLWSTKTPYTTYFEGAQFVHFMLGPATVALAVPLAAEFKRVRRLAVPILVALFAGSLTAIFSAVGIAWLLGAPHDVLASLAPKSVTTPIAMGIASLIGGLPSLTATIVVVTGILTGVIALPLTRLLRVHDHAAHGFASGLAGHGIGTARAFHDSPIAGTFAGLALALNGLLTAILAPLVMRLF
ncbi:LrgB family protein [Rhizomicrobium electricum]|jgi:predicted murein hydrolase (TIGR00659 family)|uniref:LrgB family protein n=1 Tax=Rhizomicrobium electricum TaxID=480070 RepID=A0ABN1E1N2_9PROT|nr:LrgB family protein [Rhizomicrobium electricum]NIJ47424.1 putative murein hydrolase (TIGR00659 family) [Rhizomicrobium electricum]